MFYAIRENKIDLDGYSFSHNRLDTESLNNKALKNDSDVIAISVFVYAAICDNFLMLPHGGSVGQNYGPVIIAQEEFSIEDLPRLKLAIPGINTTAANVVKMLSPDQPTTIVPIDPFYAIFESLEKGEVDAGLVIHEGRMCYESMGFKKIIDIGEWWYGETGDPLPLGANVIRRDLGHYHIKKLTKILGKSIVWAIEHREELIPFLQELKSPIEKKLGLADPEVISAYLDLYANQDTVRYGEKERNALQNFFDRAFEHSLIPGKITVEYAPEN